MEARKLNDLRLRIDAGMDVSNEEILAAIRAIRPERAARALESGTKKTSKTPPINIGPIDLKALIAAKTTKPNN